MGLKISDGALAFRSANTAADSAGGSTALLAPKKKKRKKVTWGTFYCSALHNNVPINKFGIHTYFRHTNTKILGGSEEGVG